MDSTAGVVEMLKRDIPPAHFIFMIRSFSLLSETGNQKHESGVFQAGDKKWKLCFYPKGKKQQAGGDGDRDKDGDGDEDRDGDGDGDGDRDGDGDGDREEDRDEDEDGNGYISLYLQIVDTDNYPLGWEVHVKFSLFVYDHVQDKYLTVQDAGGKVRRFHYMKTEWGFDQLLPLSTFNDPSNGYLVDDICAFGAEILVVSNATKRECLSMVDYPTNRTYTWRINYFTSKNKLVIYSDQFTVEGSKWKLKLFPRGSSSAKGKCLSLFLELADLSKLKDDGRKLYAKYKLRICNQLKSSEHNEKQAACFFGGSPAITNWGYFYFMYLDELESATKGFLVNDTLIVEAEFMLLSNFSGF